MHSATADALNAPSVMHTTDAHCSLSADASFNWPAQAHLKAAKQPEIGSS